MSSTDPCLLGMQVVEEVASKVYGSRKTAPLWVALFPAQGLSLSSLCGRTQYDPLLQTPATLSSPPWWSIPSDCEGKKKSFFTLLLSGSFITATQVIEVVPFLGFDQQSQSGWCTPWLKVMICLDSLCRRASKCYLWPPEEGKSPPCYLVPHLLIIYLNVYLMGKWKIKEQCSIKIILTILFRMFFSSSQYSRIFNFIFIYFLTDLIHLTFLV